MKRRRRKKPAANVSSHSPRVRGSLTPLERAEHARDAAAAALDASVSLSQEGGMHRSRRSIARLVRCLKKVKADTSELALDLSLHMGSSEAEALDLAKATIESLLEEFDVHCNGADRLSLRLGQDAGGATGAIDSGTIEQQQRVWADDVNGMLAKRIESLEKELRVATNDRDSALAELEGAKREIKRSLQKSGASAAIMKSVGGERIRRVQDGVRAASDSLGSLRDAVFTNFSDLMDDIAHASSALAARVHKPKNQEKVVGKGVSRASPIKSSAAFYSALVIAPKWTTACSGDNGVTMDQLLSYASQDSVQIVGPHEATIEGVAAPLSFGGVFGPDDVSQPQLLCAVISEMRDALRGKAGYVFIGGNSAAKARHIRGSDVKVGQATSTRMESPCAWCARCSRDLKARLRSLWSAPRVLTIKIADLLQPEGSGAELSGAMEMTAREGRS